MPITKWFEKDGQVHTKWNSIWFGLPIWLLFAGLNLWWLFHIPETGKAIGALAVVAGVMSVRETKVLSKILWVGLLVCMLITEFRAINKDHMDAKQEEADHLAEQRSAFSAVLTQQENEFRTTTANFEASINSLNSIIDTTKTISTLSKENLENVTGGNSFVYLLPSLKIFPGPAGKLPVKQFNLYLVNDGRYALTGVSVSISHVLEEDVAGSRVERNDDGALHPIQIGLVPGNSAITIPGLFAPGQKEIERIWVVITAQNGITRENVWFRRSANKLSWAYKMECAQYDNKNKLRHDKTVDWTEPTELQSE